VLERVQDELRAVDDEESRAELEKNAESVSSVLGSGTWGPR